MRKKFDKSEISLYNRICMDRIQGIKSSIRVSELTSLCAALGRSYESKEITRKIVNDAMKQINDYRVLLVNSSTQEKSSVSLSSADKVRDSEISALNKILIGCENMKNAEIKESAKALRSVLSRYLKDKITSKTNEEGSGMVMSLLNDFSSAKMQEYIAKLPGVADSIDAIREAQENYIKARDSKSDVKLNKSVSASSVKADVIKVVNETLVPVLNVALIENDESLVDFARSVSNEIASANAKVSARAEKGKSRGQERRKNANKSLCLKNN